MIRICALKRDAIDQAKPASKFRSFFRFSASLYSADLNMQTPE
jgi:hypothetical protein